MTTENAIALGTFDGVHIGHRRVLDLPDCYNKIAVTFYYPPKAYFSGKKEMILETSQKVAALMRLGFNEVSIEPFENFKDMSAEAFLEYIYKEFSPKYISCGFNYRFGKDGRGDSELLKSFCEQKGIELKCVNAVKFEEKTVSSTFIRSLLKNGEIEKANTLLFEPFSIEEKVVAGDKRGRTIGFPTINQKYPEDRVKIKSGVYKTRVFVCDKSYAGITYVGTRPSFETEYTICETYIDSFSGDLYDSEVKVEFISYLREEMKFSSKEDLKAQIEKDINNN